MDHVTQDNEFNASFLRMFLLGMVVISPAFISGLNLSFTTVALPQMNLSLDIASWFGAVSGISAPISTIITGVVIDKLGRKSALIYALLPSIAGWLLLLWDYSDATILAGQVLNGFTIGAVGFSSQVYAGECIMVNHVRLRSSYIMACSFSISTASLFMFSLATFLNYRQISAIVAVIAIVVLLLLCTFIPESPTWLYHRGRFEEAEKSQRKLGISQPILKIARGESQPLLQNTKDRTSFQSVLAKLRRPDVLKPLINFSSFCLIYSMCGTYCVLTYMIQIFDGTIYGVTPAANATVPAETGNPYLYNLVSGVFMLISAISAAFAMPYLGLRRTLVISMVGTLVAMVSLTYTALAAGGYLFSLRIVAVWINAFFFGLASMAPVSAAGDALPSDAKGFTCIVLLVSNVSSAIVRKIFPYLCLAIGAYTYCIFSVMSVLCALHAYFCLTEVVGKTLEEINREYLTGATEKYPQDSN